MSPQKLLTAAVLVLGLLLSLTAVSTAHPDHEGSEWPTERLVDAGPWNGVIQCESNGRAAVVSRGTPYHGLVQFWIPTWRATALSAGKPRLARKLPSEAPMAQQLRQAERLRRSAGLGQWPVCGRRYGDGTGPLVISGEVPPKYPHRCVKNLRRHHGFTRKAARSICGVE